MKLSRVLLGVSLIAYSLCGCTPTQSKSDGKTKEGGVKIGRPEKKTLRRVIEQPASIEAFEETPLVARIPGYVARVNVDIGDHVKREQVLAEISVPEMLKEHNQKQALVALANAEVEQAKAFLDTAKANIATAAAMEREADANHERWKSETRRVEALVASKVVDKQILDETLFQFRSAEAKVQLAKAMAKESEARREKAVADIKAAEARVKVAVADEERYAALADYRYLRAPFDGIVTRRNIHTGHFLHPQGGASGVVFQVARIDTLRIVSDIPESEAIFVKNDLAVKIQAPIFKTPPVEAKIRRTSWTLDAKARTLRIEIDYPNKDAVFRPGMFVNVSFAVEFKDRITLPASAIFLHNDQPCCWRVVDGKAVRTPLKLGGREVPLVEILLMQVRENTWENPTGQEDVVLTNLGAVTDGKEVPEQRK